MAQPSLPGLSFEIKKPKAFEARELPSEKTGNKKFTAPRRFYNNLVSRFNYYFNANTKLNEAIEQAKLVYRDDYTQLLNFYNYTLDETAKGQMDTIIYKCVAGILLHDLRSDWVDKLYLLMGKTYLYRKDFDSAGTVFQYINYAFSPKDNGYDIPIGSNASNTNGIFTIATRENPGTWKKLTSFPPSRNESFLWQVRNYIEKDELVEAEGLLELIRTDPNFPERLRVDLHETTAYLKYKQHSYEKAADELILALGNATDHFEKARWEFLAGQMFQLAKNDAKAILLYERAILHTTDPLMEVYARMNIVGLATTGENNAIQKNLDELIKMAKKDKYETNRDIIYYAAAKLELKRKNYIEAQKHLLNSIKYSVDNPLQKQLSFLLLGDMNYPLKNYAFSHRFYDSIQTSLLLKEDKIRVEERKPALKIISENQETIYREDSLQKIALLPPEQRDLFLNDLLKRLRKEKGLKDLPQENLSFGNTLAGNTGLQAAELFSSNGSEFYFQSASTRARGLAEFKSKWGNRPNVDNWRRQSAVNSSFATASPGPADKNLTATIKKDVEPELTIASLSKNIPLTTGQSDSSHKAIIKALMENAATFQNQLEDYPSAIETYEELLRRYPESSEIEPALFNLAYCYKKTGNQLKTDSLTAAIKQAFPKGTYVNKINTAQENLSRKKTDPAQKEYENIYSMFLEGNFEKAKQAKLKADKEFGKNYWTPQLLYIESIYYIRQKDDSIAINRLESIQTLFPKS
ncbi:MAG: hypothetical protein RLZZ28_1361, partial [Bacteroidota bacterium]